MDTRDRTRSAALLAPALLLLGLLAVSTALLVVYSVYRYRDGGGMIPDFTLDNYARILGQPLYPKVIANTLVFGVVVTAVSLLLGYPLAYYLRGLSPRWRAIGFLLVIAPLWTSIIVRTYGWAIILGVQGVVNSFLKWLGPPGTVVFLYPGFWAVVIGLVQISLPLMVLPIFTSLRSLDPSLEESSQTLGASPLRTFVKVTLPLSLPGVFAGVVLTFVLVIGAYVTPVLLGSPRELVLPVLIEGQISAAYNIPFASSLALVMLAIMAVVIAVFRRSVRLDRLFGA
jgi:ABC-type spermidine/putrescine transport system permease subunit I